MGVYFGPTLGVRIVERESGATVFEATAGDDDLPGSDWRERVLRALDEFGAEGHVMTELCEVSAGGGAVWHRYMPPDWGVMRREMRRQISGPRAAR